MLLNIILDIRWIVHHPSEHRYSRNPAGIDNGRCPAVASIDQASLRLQHIDTQEKIGLAIRDDRRYLRVPLSETYVCTDGTIPYRQSFLIVEPNIVPSLRPGPCQSRGRYTHPHSHNPALGDGPSIAETSDRKTHCHNAQPGLSRT